MRKSGPLQRMRMRLSTSSVPAVDQSVRVSDQALVDRLLADPDFPLLVSFPRTGSHWLRMLMELYFGRPSLVRSFYYHDRRDFLMLHTHDLGLTVTRSNVIYLYRNPVDTIYSQLRYDKEDTDNRERVTHWADLYGRHLDKWLCTERFTAHKTILTYEGMKNDVSNEFQMITRHFDTPFDAEKLQRAISRVTKDEVKKKTQHDPQAIQLGDDYAIARARFAERQGRLVWETLFDRRRSLEQFLPDWNAV
jgi:hypothetical protein